MKKLLLLFSLLVLTVHLIGQPVWQWQNPNPPMVNFQSISMIDTTEGWMTVGTNSLMHYTNGQWDLYNTPVSMIYPSSVLFLSQNTGWVGCMNGIYRFDGTNWQKILGNLIGIKDMFFFNQNSGWAIASGGEIMKINGLNAVLDTVFQQTMNALYFPDSSHGWAVGDSGTIKSYYGNYWYNWPPITTKNLRDVYFTDLYHGWAVGDSGTILYFNGNNWQIQNSGVNFNILTVDFTDSLHGFAAGYDYTMIFYNGTSWSHYCTAPSFVLSLDMVTSSRGFAACYFGTIINITPNSAIAYPSVNLTQNELFGMSFSDNNHGWAVGSYGTMLKYLNGTWSLLPQITNANLLGTYFPDLQHGWCVGQYGTILNYNNGNWNGQFSGTGNYLCSVHFVDTLNGWAVGQFGVILRYQNNTWTQEVSNTDSSLLSVFFTDTTNGWAVGQDGVILHYSNGIWNNYNNMQGKYLNSVYFVSPNDGWAVGDSGTIMHYNGLNWQVDTIIPYYNLQNMILFRSVYFEASNNGWAVGKDCLYHYDGINWTDFSYTLPSEYPYNSIVFPDLLNGWAAGAYGNIIYCYKPNLEITNTFEIPDEKINYNEVYPNPCGSYCIFKIANNNNEKIKVKVVGITGQELQVSNVAENENNETKLVFNVSNLEPGLYFLTVETSNKRIVKKIIRK